MGGGHSVVKSALVQRNGDARLKIASCDMLGGRDTMEDEMIIKTKLSDLHPTTALVAIFDGHSGRGCASFMKEHLQGSLGSLDDPHDKSGIQDVFETLDKKFMTENRNSNAGTCAVVCVITPEESGDKKEKTTTRFKLTTIWLGDSRVLLASGNKGGVFVPLTRDHVPHDEEEKKRILKDGHCVYDKRVDGNLAVSRAIGDAYLKTNRWDKPARELALSPIPEVETRTVTSGDILILACDGVYEKDELVAKKLSKMTRDVLKEEDMNLDDLVLSICHESAKTSGDNMSIIAVSFTPGQAWADERSEFLPEDLPVDLMDHHAQRVIEDAFNRGYDLPKLQKLASEIKDGVPRSKRTRPESDPKQDSKGLMEDAFAVSSTSSSTSSSNSSSAEPQYSADRVMDESDDQQDPSSAEFKLSMWPGFLDLKFIPTTHRVDPEEHDGYESPGETFAGRLFILYYAQRKYGVDSRAYPKGDARLEERIFLLSQLWVNWTEGGHFFHRQDSNPLEDKDTETTISKFQLGEWIESAKLKTPKDSPISVQVPNPTTLPSLRKRRKI